MAAGGPRGTSRPTTDRIALGVVVLASAWFAFTAFWGFAGIPGGGHLGAGSAGNVHGRRADRQVAHPLSGVGLVHGRGAAEVGVHLPSPVRAVLGAGRLPLGLRHHDFVVHLPAALMSAAVPPMLYGIAREKWGPRAGRGRGGGLRRRAGGRGVLEPSRTWRRSASSARSSSSGATRATWAPASGGTWSRASWGSSSRARATGRGTCSSRRRSSGSSCAGFVLPRRLVPRFKFEPYARWWGLAVGIVAGHAAALARALREGRPDRRLGHGGVRAAPAARARSSTRCSRRARTGSTSRSRRWRSSSASGRAPICLLRLLWTRRDEEIYSLSLLFGATVQYVVFKRGADIHIFWSIYFAPYYALALAQLVHTVGAVAGFVVEPLRARRPEGDRRLGRAGARASRRARDGARRRRVALGVAAHGGALRRQRDAHPQPHRSARRWSSRCCMPRADARHVDRHQRLGAVGLGASVEVARPQQQRGPARRGLEASCDAPVLDRARQRPDGRRAEEGRRCRRTCASTATRGWSISASRWGRSTRTR